TGTEISPGWQAAFDAGFSVLWVLLTSLIIAVFNSVTGGADSFLADFGSLALSFALIRAVVVAVLLPLMLPFALIGSALGILIVAPGIDQYGRFKSAVAFSKLMQSSAD